MPDKKYKELSKRLETKNKKKSGGNFRSYEKMQQDVRSDEQRMKDKSEAPSGRGKKGQGSKSSNDSYWKKMATAIAPFAVAAILIFICIYALTNKNATEIRVNDEVIGQLKTVKLTEEEFISTLTAKIEQVEETKIRLTDNITLTPVHGKSKLIMDYNDLLNLMAEVTAYKLLAAEISVDGERVGVAKNQEEAAGIFDSIMAQYVEEGAEDVTSSFVQDVAATDIYVSSDEIDSPETLRAELSKPVTTSYEYVVVEGDMLSSIAAANGCSVNDIKEQNPGLDVTATLQIGQRLNIVSTVPYVSVRTIESIVETVEIPMETDEQPDPTLPSGQRKIKQQGKPGKKEVVTQITKINGAITSKSEPTERIIEPAVTRIELVGTG